MGSPLNQFGKSSGIDPYGYIKSLDADYPEETRLRLFLQHFPQLINPYARDVLQFIEMRLTAKRTLDAGCGAGWVSYHLRRKTNLHGVDISPVPIEKYRRLFETTGDRYSVSRQDLTSLALAANTFDGAISVGAISVVNDVNEFLQEIARVLEPGGEFFLTVPDCDRLTFAKTTRWELLFESHGLEVDAVGHCGCLPDKYAVRLGRLLDIDIETIGRVLELRSRYVPMEIDALSQDRVYRLVHLDQ